MSPLYLRREKVLIPINIGGTVTRWQVSAFKDKAARQHYATWPWHSPSKPRRNAKTATLNCYRWPVEWVQQ